MNNRDVVLQVAWYYLGRPYIWGGDNPQGFDCSGLVIECLKSIGRLPRKGDWSADGLYKLFAPKIQVQDVEPGDLVFWYDSAAEKYVHVEIVVSKGLSIGASGGGSWATDAQLAFVRGAYIKVRPYATRGGEMSFINPYKGG